MSIYDASVYPWFCVCVCEYVHGGQGSMPGICIITHYHFETGSFTEPGADRLARPARQ